MGVSDKGFENLKCSKFKKQQSKYKARCIFTEYAEKEELRRCLIYSFVFNWKNVLDVSA